MSWINEGKRPKLAPSTTSTCVPFWNCEQRNAGLQKREVAKTNALPAIKKVGPDDGETTAALAPGLPRSKTRRRYLFARTDIRRRRPFSYLGRCAKGGKVRWKTEREREEGRFQFRSGRLIFQQTKCGHFSRGVASLQSSVRPEVERHSLSKGTPTPGWSRVEDFFG